MLGLRLFTKSMQGEDVGRFHGQAAIISGAGGEIGFAAASRLGGEGASVAVVDFHRDRGDAALARLGEAGVDARLVVGDVGDPSTAAAAVEAALDAWGRVDVLVNNAGGGGTYDYGNIWELPADALDASFRNNFMGAFHFTRAAAPHMMERDYGRIVNVASVAGKEGEPAASAVLGLEGGGHRADQVRGQGACPNRHPRKLHHPCRRYDAAQQGVGAAGAGLHDREGYRWGAQGPWKRWPT